MHWRRAARLRCVGPPDWSGQVLDELMGELVGFLRQQSRPLRLSALTTLDALVTSAGRRLSEAVVAGVVAQVGPPCLGHCDVM